MLHSLNIVPLQVIAYGIGAAFVSEFLSYVLMYRTSSFKRLKASFQTYEPVPSAAQGSTQSGNSKTAKKKEAKMKGFEAEVGRKMAVVQVVSGIMTFAIMVMSFKIVPMLFGTNSIGQLPFEPPGFLRKITQRGIENGGVRDFSPFFIFMLCQGSVRVIVGKLLGWGPSRKMQSFKPDMEKILKTA